jgi:hypothetical protein
LADGDSAKGAGSLVDGIMAQKLLTQDADGRKSK